MPAYVEPVVTPGHEFSGKAEVKTESKIKLRGKRMWNGEKGNKNKRIMFFFN